MSTIQKSIDVQVPVHTAYNQWTQFESFPNFMEGVERVDQIDDTHTHWKIKIGPADREVDATITRRAVRGIGEERCATNPGSRRWCAGCRARRRSTPSTG